MAHLYRSRTHLDLCDELVEEEYLGNNIVRTICVNKLAASGESRMPYCAVLVGRQQSQEQFRFTRSYLMFVCNLT